MQSSDASLAPGTDALPNLAPTPGGSRELLKLAAPLIVSQSFMTVQVFVDAVLLAHHNRDEMTAAFPAVMWFWLWLGPFQMVTNYTSTFVAQYTGAARPHRVGPAVWQGIYIACFGGLALLLIDPLASQMIRLGEHPEHLQKLQIVYLRWLAYAALPMLILGALNGFFSGRGRTWTVLVIEALGTGVNVLVARVLIPGELGFPEMGIGGAGLATAVGSWASALFALVLFLLPSHRAEFASGSGWRLDTDLMKRYVRYGGPAGMQIFLDVVVWVAFTQLVGQLGDEAMAATTLAIRLNMIAFLPMMGLGQAVSILVGQRLGSNEPHLAEHSTYTGLRWSLGYAFVVAAVYLLLPRQLVAIFESEQSREQFHAIAAIVRTLLICVAVYSLADAVNLTFAFALRGAGDTWFVSLVMFFLAWPILVLPTYIAVRMKISVYWPWAFATAYLFAMSICFFLRFRTGKWKLMRVIESAPQD